MVLEKTERKLPEGWKWVKLGEVCEVVTGSTPSKGESRFYGGSIPWIKPDNLDKTMYVEKSSEYLTEDGAKEARLLPPGSVLVSCIGNLGKLSIARKPLATNQQINSLIPSNEIDSVFLFFACKTLRTQLNSAATITIVPIVNKTAFSKLSIPLPPLPEQKRIAAILTEQMAAVEKARVAAEAQLEAAKALPAAYLKKVFPQPGQDLPQGWKWVKLIDLCTRSGQYGTSRKSNAQGTGLPVLGMSHIHEGQIRWANVATIDLPENERKQYLLKAGDLLFNRTNSAELVGKTAVYDRVDDAVFASYLIRFHIDSSLADSHYVSAYINSSTARLFIEKNMARAIGQVNISASTMHGCPIPIPPLPEQKRIAAMLKEEMTEAERLRKAIEDQLKEINAMPAALLRKAFNGEL